MYDALSKIKKWFEPLPRHQKLAKKLLRKINRKQPEKILDRSTETLGGEMWFDTKTKEANIALRWPVISEEELYFVAHEVGHVLQTNSIEIFSNSPIKLLELEAEMYAHQFFRLHNLNVPKQISSAAREYVGSYPETLSLSISNDRFIKAKLYRAYREIKPRAEAWISGDAEIPTHRMLTIG